jgi:pyridoxal phosphate enzyme (YggS family)
MAIAEALQRLYERIHKVCIRVGRDPKEVRLMGVSKFHEQDALEEAWQGGIRLFGENRVQEAGRKFLKFKQGHPQTELHMIGSLQRNKARTAVALFDCIQSIDRDELITELGTLTFGWEQPLMILLELHTGEVSKAGYPDTEHLLRATERVLQFPNLIIRGLMTMAPFTEDKELIRSSFRTLVSARDQLQVRFPDCDWSCLSMGMSNDFEIALEEGATLLRIGTALFGARTG